MIDQHNDARTGWARFSDDMTMRYRLARSLSDVGEAWMREPPGVRGGVDALRIVWLMLNPSTADAFKPDPTITECRKRSVARGADVLEVVNLFAFRTPYPRDLKACPIGSRGACPVNNAEILAACGTADMVIAAWGNGGELRERSAGVLDMLSEHGIALHHLGLTNSGAPKHPLARGKHRIAADQQPIAWEVDRG